MAERCLSCVVTLTFELALIFRLKKGYYIVISKPLFTKCNQKMYFRQDGSNTMFSQGQRDVWYLLQERMLNRYINTNIVKYQIELFVSVYVLFFFCLEMNNSEKKEEI